MPQLLPFRGIRYTPTAGPLDQLLAPPYDVISPAQQRALTDRNEHNAVRLELAEGGDERYARVAALFEGWLADATVAQDEAPMLYVYEQRFTEAGQEYARRGLLAEVEAQPWDEGAVKPHEYTLTGPKEDRLRLLNASGVQFSPVFMIARDRAGGLREFIDTTVTSRDPDMQATTPDGDTHRLWAVQAGRYEMRMLAPLLAESFYIADGHHRYETQVNYKREQLEANPGLDRDHPARFAMAAIVPAADPGLVIRPIHRIVPRSAPSDWRERIAPHFVATEVTAGDQGLVAQLLGELAADPEAIAALGLDRGTAHILRPRDPSIYAAMAPEGHSDEWARIGPNALRYGVLAPLWEISDEDLRSGAVEYTHVAEEVAEAVDGDGDATGFLLSPVDIAAVMSLADKGERMPQKSTFFHPKLGTGLVFHALT